MQVRRCPTRPRLRSGRGLSPRSATPPWPYTLSSQCTLLLVLCSCECCLGAFCWDNASSAEKQQRFSGNFGVGDCSSCHDLACASAFEGQCVKASELPMGGKPWGRVFASCAGAAADQTAAGATEMKVTEAAALAAPTAPVMQGGEEAKTKAATDEATRKEEAAPNEKTAPKEKEEAGAWGAAWGAARGGVAAAAEALPATERTLSGPVGVGVWGSMPAPGQVVPFKSASLEVSPRPLVAEPLVCGARSLSRVPLRHTSRSGGADRLFLLARCQGGEGLANGGRRTHSPRRDSCA